MFPSYRNMDPCSHQFPYQREQIPYPYHWYPNWEARPLHITSPCGPWPYNNQVEHHNCCNHSYPYCYYGLRPPYFQQQHPPQMYYHGPYPPHHDAYPPFFIPTHFNHAKYDYDNEKNHCCGCPNHISHRKEGNNVKIEEQNASPTIDEGTVTMPKGNHSGLIQYPCNRYPMMWLPDSGTSNGTKEKLMESWPVVAFKDNLKDLREGHGESANEDGKKVVQFPYPIFWLPGNEKLEEALKDKKEIDATAKAADSSPSNLKIVPLKFSDNEKHVEKSEVVEEETKTQHSMNRVAEKERKVKTIPVVHFDSVNGEKPCQLDRPEDVLKNSIAEEEKHDVAKKKDSGKKQPSPSKASKLPPVCLRVDPLPKKNGSNGKNHSPAPASVKEKVKSLEGNHGHVAIMKNDSDNVPIKDIKVIDVKYQPSGEGVEGTAATIVSGQGMESIEEQCAVNDRKDVTTDVDVPVEGNLGNNNEEKGDIYMSQQQKLERKGEKVDLSDDNKKKMQKKYSQEDAALLIQSVSRGFNVRRWKPLKKLRQIAQIRVKVTDIKSQIQNYESSLELDLKHKVIISETIMNLLLQLDTIQGLHPSLREVRKSVARDLVHLQDKLDQLYNQITQKRDGETQKEEITTRDSTASSINSTSVERPPLIENILSDRPPHMKEENVSVQESGGFSMASDKPSCVTLEDDVQEPEGQSHVEPFKMLNDEVVPSGVGEPVKMLNDEVVPSGVGKYVTRHHEDENDKQDDNLLSAETNASIDEKSMSQDEVVHPPQSEISDFVLKRQLDEDQSTNCKEMQAVKAPDLNDLKHNSTQENPSHSLLAVQRINAPDEEAKQSLFGEVTLKAESALEKGTSKEEGSDIKAEEAIAEKNEESNVMRATFDASEELKPSFKYADEGSQSDESQVEQELTGMNANQSSDVEKDETQVILSPKEDSEMKESAQTEESAASPVLKNDSQELAEVNSKIPQVDPGIGASIDDQGGVDFKEVADSRIMHNVLSVVPEDAAESSECANNNALPITSVASSGNKETAYDSSDEMSRENNLTEYSQHEKNTSDAFLHDEMNYKEKKLVEENEKLRQMLEKLLHAGQEQMGAINDLNERVKNLERKLTNRKKVEINRRKKFYKLPVRQWRNDVL